MLGSLKCVQCKEAFQKVLVCAGEGRMTLQYSKWVRACSITELLFCVTKCVIGMCFKYMGGRGEQTAVVCTYFLYFLAHRSI